MESGGGSRRRQFFSEEKVDSPNLRDFLRVKEDGDGRKCTGLTLSAVLSSEKRPSPAQVNRTLLDIIRDDPNGGNDNKKSWKIFREKLRLRRAGAAWVSSVPTPASDVPIQNSNRMISRRNSTRFPSAISEDQSSINGGEGGAEMNSMPSNRAMMLRHNSTRISSLPSSRFSVGIDGSTSLITSENNGGEAAGEHQRMPSAEQAEDREEETEEGEGEREGGGEPEVRMSLMALLAETDRQMGFDEFTYTMDGPEEEEEEEEEESGGGEFNNCCVCMVRHKGAAFIPCGHTFCRLCSRELWVQRGNCPLCNGFILEILDIF
ncbi:hypothetical protein U1Q18_049545 [Sarracenia purpurea var. burkii]